MFLFIYFVIYFFLVFIIRSFILWRNTGINPMTFGRTDDAHGFNGKIFKFISFLELIVIVIFTFKHEWYDYLLPFWYLEHSLAHISGWVLLIISLVWVCIAQGQMSRSWRIGIDEINKSELVTSGLFSISRNPIFLGIIITNLGLFLVIPNAFTLLITMLSTITINTQIRLEEVFLLKEFGSEYRTYKQKVRRWI